jgi:uncharacterized phage protein gp47/JayE
MASSILNTRTADEILNDMVAAFQATQPTVAVDEASTLYILMQIFAFVSGVNVATAQTFALAAFIETAVGDDLSALGADRGIPRDEGTAATVLLEFSRISLDPLTSYTIPASTNVSTEIDDSGNFIQFFTLEAATLAASTLSVTALAQASEVGATSNVAANTITNFIDFVNGIDSVTNPSSASGGINAESDDEYRDRIRSVLADNTGRVTVLGYEQFLESLSGCLSATVVPGTGAMPNYINAFCTSNSTPDGIPTAEEIAFWQTEVNKDANRAVVDVITVLAPSSITVTVSATISEYSTDADEAATRTNVQTNVIDYINGLSPGVTVRVVDISNVIHDDTGVLDFTLHLPSSNIDLETSQKSTANIGTVTIN